MRAARPIAALMLLCLCLWLFDARAILDRLAELHLGWLSAAVAALVAQTALMALRWRLVARCLGTEMGRAWAVREYLASQFANATLPGGIVGDAGRAVRARAGASGLRGAATAVAVERGMGQAGLAAIAAAGLAATVLTPASFTLPGPFVASVAAALTGLALTLAAVLRTDWGMRLARLCLPSARVAWVQTLLSLGAALLNVAAFAAAARATGTALGPAAAAVLVPVILTAMLIPFTVGGWGWREGAAAALFPLAGAAPAAGVAAGIAFGVAVLISVLPLGALAMAFRPSGRARPIDGANLRERCE